MKVDLSISLIIPTSGTARSQELTELFASIARQTLRPIEVIVVHSTESLLHIEGSESVRVMTIPREFGASAARNRAAMQAKGTVLGFLDDDVVLDPRWCEFALATFIEPTVGAVSGKATVELNQFALDYLPTTFMWVVGGSYWNFPVTTQVGGAAGMNFCVRKDCFIEVGGFNEMLGPKGDRPEHRGWRRLGAEEGDLAVRVRLLCRQTVLFNPKMVVSHRVRRGSVSLVAIAKRSLHVGHNRAYIRHRFFRLGRLQDSISFSPLIKTIAVSAAVFKQPVVSWKRLSFMFFVLSFFLTGYAFGLLEFGVRGRKGTSGTHMGLNKQRQA